MELIKLGQYRHYKGKLYEVVGFAINAQDDSFEELVLYKPLYRTKFKKDTVFAQSKSRFLEKVSVNGIKVARFKYVEDGR